MKPCPICPGLFPPLPGDGPTPCDILFLGERPGENENQQGCVFVERSGEELNDTYLSLAGLKREDVRIRNVVACWAENNRTPNEKEILGCARHFIPKELARCQPKTIVLLGSSACKLVGGINLEAHHGRPRYVENFLGTDWSGYVFPTYHPAAGMRKGDIMQSSLDDFEVLGRWLRGRWEAPKQLHTGKTDYALITDEGNQGRELGYYFMRSAEAKNRYKKEIAIDTERHGSTPWSIQFSLAPGSARMIRADQPRLLKLFAERLYQNQSTVILHNAPQDMDILNKLGVRVDKFRDTMQEAFHQGDLPQKLKALAYRLLGVSWNSWEEVVRPASVEKAVEWLGEALSIAQADLKMYSPKILKRARCLLCNHNAHEGRKCRGAKNNCECVGGGEVSNIIDGYKNHPVETALTRIIRCSTNPEYDIWEKLEELFGKWEDEREHIDKLIGPMPILGIGNCALNAAVEYGCADADFTGQVAVRLKERRDRYTIVDEDADQT